MLLLVPPLLELVTVGHVLVYFCQLRWRVVDEYVSNPLAEDSDDEKKIYKAQTRAESKLKKEKAKRNGRTDQKITPYDFELVTVGHVLVYFCQLRFR
jgi:hypothetical protein